MSDKVIHYCRHCGDTLGGDNPCDCPAASIDAVLAGQANEISALTERLRIVEAERDELRNERDRWRDASFCADQREMTTRKCFPQGAELADLRAELERKDAALKFYADKKNYSLVAGCVPEDDEPAPAQDDCGAIARAALENLRSDNDGR